MGGRAAETHCVSSTIGRPWPFIGLQGSQDSPITCSGGDGAVDFDTQTDRPMIDFETQMGPVGLSCQSSKYALSMSIGTRWVPDVIAHYGFSTGE